MINLGLIEDPRSEEDKSKDYRIEETIPMAVQLKWNRDISGCPVYSVRDQDGSSSCVAQASAKGLEILKGEVMSAHPIYRRRSNFPSLGMWLQSAGEIIKKLGTTTEAKVPSQKMSEEQMNAEVVVDTPIKGFLYAFPNFKNIDEIATAIEVYKQCQITLGFNEEYPQSEKPIYNGKPAISFHDICGIYYFTDENGEKCIVCDESWGQIHTRRIITESYLKERATGAMYFIPPIEPKTPVKPKFRFTVPLEYGTMGSLGVRNLQEILKYEGIMPQNVISTGNFLEITRKSLLEWQIKHQVAPMEELNQLQGRRVGKKTIKKLNELYNK